MRRNESFWTERERRRITKTGERRSKRGSNTKTEREKTQKEPKERYL